MVARIIDFSARNRFIVFLLLFGLAAAGLWALRNAPIDAVPDISDTQVIIYTTWMGRSPDLVEDQITYPIVTALLSAPRVTAVRGFSDFGSPMSMSSLRTVRISTGPAVGSWNI